jgi:hypothetical protein
MLQFEKRIGLLPSTADRRIVRTSAATTHIMQAKLGALQGNADLATHAPKIVLNQGQSDTCFIHSWASLRFVLDSLKTGSAILQSPLYGAQCVYAEYRAMAYPTGNFPSAGLTDGGAQLDDVARCVTKWGSVPFGTPQQSLDTDVPATTDFEGNPILLPELTAAALESGAKAPFGGEYDLPISETVGDLCAAALEAGIPIWLGGEVGQNLQAYKAGEIEQPPAAGDPSVGGHARALLGYKTVTVDGTLQRLWNILNSWGKAWGNGGYSWASESVLTSSTSWSLLPMMVS